MKKFDAVLQEYKDITSTVRHFVFSVPDDFTFKAGQFMITTFQQEGKTVKRSYSIASPPQKKNYIDLCVKKVENGLGTKFYFGLKKGDKANLTGPLGAFKIG